MSHKDSFFYLTQKGRIYLSRCLLGPTIAWTHLSAGSQHGSFPHRLTGPHVSHTDQHFPRPQPSPNNYILKNTCFQGKPIVLVQTLTPPRRRRRPPDGRAARESLPRLPAAALCLIRRPPARGIRIGFSHVKGQGLRRRQRGAPQGVLGLRGPRRTVGVSRIRQ
jgi:hypothetical protein